VAEVVGGVSGSRDVSPQRLGMVKQNVANACREYNTPTMVKMGGSLQGTWNF